MDIEQDTPQITGRITLQDDFNLGLICDLAGITESELRNPAVCIILQNEFIVYDKPGIQQKLDAALKQIKEKNIQVPNSVRQRTLKALNDVLYNLRLTLNPNIPGQDVLYQEKADEAKDYISAGYPDSLDDYPLINAEHIATGKDPSSIAENILSKRAEWLYKLKQIEELRLKTQHIIRTSNDITEIEQAFQDSVQRINEMYDIFIKE